MVILYFKVYVVAYVFKGIRMQYLGKREQVW